MLDALILGFDKALRTLFVEAPAWRANPGSAHLESELSASEKARAGALMRVNHVGEVCAQALYQGQAYMSDDVTVQRALEKAAREETEHLAWTEQRIRELGAHKSLLNPLWYAGALSIGVFAGRLGDSWSLGFLEETERQVGAHLERHLAILPAQDAKSRAIVRQMRDDELSHADTALRLGARKLPSPAKFVMRLAARAMTRTAYHI